MQFRKNFNIAQNTGNAIYSCISKGEFMNIYDFKLKNINGDDVSLGDFRGHVIMIVNTATGCGFTPQYDAIEKIYEKYHNSGFDVIDIPCNQFGAQAPGSDSEIHEFCTLHFNTKFDQMKKSDVNGPNELPLYKYLKSQAGFAGFDEHPYKKQFEEMFAKSDANWDKNPDIKWNFTKFIIDRNGNVVKRFEPTADMKVVEDFIKDLI